MKLNNGKPTTHYAAYTIDLYSCGHGDGHIHPSKVQAMHPATEATRDWWIPQTLFDCIQILYEFPDSQSRNDWVRSAPDGFKQYLRADSKGRNRGRVDFTATGIYFWHAGLITEDQFNDYMRSN